METSVYLCNPGKHNDSLIFQVINAEDMLIKICAFGIGTSILVEPELPEEFNLGILLTRRKYNYPLKFTNKGIRLHRIKWSNQKVLKNPKPAKPGEVIVEKP